MELIKSGTSIDFIGKRWLALLGSMGFIVFGLIGTFIWPGPNWGIDFAGGAEMQVAFKEPVDMGKLRDAVESLDVGEVKVQQWLEMGEESSNNYLIRMEELRVEDEDTGASDEESEKSATKVQNKLEQVFGKDSFEIMKTDYVGPKVGEELKRNGIMAIFIAMVLLLVYISLRFEFRFALGAVLALIHDVIITTGIFVWAHKDFNLAIIAALLTIVGYSLNDTIVVYDRIRENVRKLRRLGFKEMVNASINETLSRTILTSATTLLVVFFLWLMGGGVIHDFAFTLLIGIMVGTYSSIFVAGSFIIWWDDIRARRRSPAVAGKTG